MNCFKQLMKIQANIEISHKNTLANYTYSPNVICLHCATGPSFILIITNIITTQCDIMYIETVYSVYIYHSEIHYIPYNILDADQHKIKIVYYYILCVALLAM